jgi:hypothetical protein
MQRHEIEQRERGGMVKEGTDTHVLRLDAYRVRRSGRRVVRPPISFRVHSCWASLVRRCSRSSGGQEVGKGEDVKSPAEFVHEIREPIEIEIPCKSKLRKWAFENAYTLIFLSILCVINIIGNIIVVLVLGS